MATISHMRSSESRRKGAFTANNAEPGKTEAGILAPGCYPHLSSGRVGSAVGAVRLDPAANRRSAVNRLGSFGCLTNPLLHREPTPERSLAPSTPNRDQRTRPRDHERRLLGPVNGRLERPRAAAQDLHAIVGSDGAGSTHSSFQVTSCGMISAPNPSPGAGNMSTVNGASPVIPLYLPVPPMK